MSMTIIVVRNEDIKEVKEKLPTGKIVTELQLTEQQVNVLKIVAGIK